MPNPLPAPTTWRARAALLWPAPLAIDGRERWRVLLGVGLGLLATGLLSQAAGAGTPWLVAPLGASAVLVFGVPASPLAQPWSVVGGNTLSALVGIAVVHAASAGAALVAAAPAGAALPLAAAAAGAGAVAVMLLLRCLHPPGGAVALLTVLGGVADWRFALFPVFVNSLLLVTAGVAYNRLSGRPYPHPNRHREAPPAVPPRFSEADIDRVLARYNQVLDLPRDDLEALLEAAETESHRRRLGALRCRDIMSQPVAAVEFGAPLHEAWALLREREVKALPVVDRARRIVGIVTRADFMRHAELDPYPGFDDRLRRLLRATPGIGADKPEVVGQIMTRQVRVASADRSLAELVPIFSSTGHHHIPVVGDDGRLAGIVTQTDVVRALALEQAP